MSRPLTKLYVAKFGSNIGRRELEDVFGKYGEIYSCRMNDGYATVSYKYQENAEKAISKLNGSNVFGGNLLVEHTLKKSRDDGYTSRSSRDGRYSDYRDYNSSRSGPSGSRYGGRDYDGDRDRYDSFRKTGPSRADKEKFIKEGLCFICGGQGHIARRCPEGRGGGSSGRGRVQSFRSDRERKSYRDRSRSYERNKGKSKSRSPYDKHEKDRKKKSRKHSKRSSSSSSNSKKSNSRQRKDKKRSASSSSRSSRTNSNSSHSNSKNRQKQSNGDNNVVGNQNDQKKEAFSSQ